MLISGADCGVRQSSSSLAQLFSKIPEGLDLFRRHPFVDSAQALGELAKVERSEAGCGGLGGHSDTILTKRDVIFLLAAALASPAASPAAAQAAAQAAANKKITSRFVKMVSE